MLTLLIFLIILSFLVFVHELGHYLAAKKAGVRVEEFGLGIPPRFFSKKVGETVYSLNLLPFGGFVKLTGEDVQDSTLPPNDPKNFMSKKPITRAVILIAGIFMNFMFSFVIYQFMLSLNGCKSQTIPLYGDYDFRFGEERRINTVVTGIEDNSPAFTAGVKFGEAIIEIDDIPVYSVKEVRETLLGKEGKDVKLLLMNVRTSQRETRAVTAVPKFGSEGRAQIGVFLGSAVTLNYGAKPGRYLAGPMHSYNMMAYTVKIFSSLVSTSFKEKNIGAVGTGVSGPVGILHVVSEILKVKGKDTILSLLDLTALLSLSLGFMNLIPFPALDGGRLAFVMVELVSGKRVHPHKEALIHKLGMAILLALIVVITFKDIGNLLG